MVIYTLCFIWVRFDSCSQNLVLAAQGDDERLCEYMVFTSWILKFKEFYLFSDECSRVLALGAGFPWIPNVVTLASSSLKDSFIVKKKSFKDFYK